MLRLSLTHREKQIISLVSNGYTAKEVARKLDLAYRTVEKYASNARKKLCARNMTHAVYIAMNNNIIEHSYNCKNDS